MTVLVSGGRIENFGRNAYRAGRETRIIGRYTFCEQLAADTATKR